MGNLRNETYASENCKRDVKKQKRLNHEPDHLDKNTSEQALAVSCSGTFLANPEMGSGPNTKPSGQATSVSDASFASTTTCAFCQSSKITDVYTFSFLLVSVYHSLITCVAMQRIPIILNYNLFCCCECFSAYVFYFIIGGQNDMSQAIGPMLHYSSGKSVAGDEATRSNVIHVHQACIEWYVICL